LIRRSKWPVVHTCGPFFEEKWDLLIQLSVLGSQFGLELCMFARAELQVLQSVAVQLMNEDVVALEDQKLRVKRVGSGRLRIVQFTLDGRMFEAIEQNPDKPSRWGRLAREKHQVVQFRDLATHKYVAVAVDGEITQYGRGES
jgi:hypothetical protein